jgi:hypothetical protein
MKEKKITRMDNILRKIKIRNMVKMNHLLIVIKNMKEMQRKMKVLQEERKNNEKNKKKLLRQ